MDYFMKEVLNKNYFMEEGLSKDCFVKMVLNKDYSEEEIQDLKLILEESSNKNFNFNID